MHLLEKIERLIERDRWPSIRSIAVAADIDDSTLDRAIRRGGSGLAVGRAMAIARALGVRVEWLFDEDQGWPPPPAIEAPPIAIVPWPPHGITWAEVKLAIAEYAAVRAAHEALDEMEAEAFIQRTEDRVGKLRSGQRERMVRRVAAVMKKQKKKPSSARSGSSPTSENSSTPAQPGRRR